MKNRTWPVFLIGLGSLLALLFLPGLTALHKTQEVYREIRAVQQAHQRNQASLNEIERRIYLTSILVRELLLDSSPLAGSRYLAEFRQNQAAVARQLAELKRSSPLADAAAMERLETELDAYWASLAPVFGWTPRERQERATFFLREQQRPRRQSILGIAHEVESLASAAFKQQYERVNSSQQVFHTDIQRINAVAFFIGVLIAAGSILRISSLEHRSERQRHTTERAEEQLRHLSTQLMRAQEEERRTISRELHDEVGQMLTALRMELGSLERLRTDPAQFNDHLSEAKNLAEQTMRTVRDLAVGLRPSVLDLGLVPALQWQARDFSRRSGIPVTVHAEGSFDRVEEVHKTCVYRIVQEALTNCAKHASASTAEISLRSQDGTLEVAVRDDGRGFDPARSQQGGLGLIGIEERVRELGGTIRMEGKKGEGSSLTVVLKGAGTNT